MEKLLASMVRQHGPYIMGSYGFFDAFNQTAQEEEEEDEQESEYSEDDDDDEEEEEDDEDRQDEGELDRNDTSVVQLPTSRAGSWTTGYHGRIVSKRPLMRPPRATAATATSATTPAKSTPYSAATPPSS
jgi:hypothetical protein